jgi:hypothetical protein
MCRHWWRPGHRRENFYNHVPCRLGLEEAAVGIQCLYLAAHKSEALAVPDLPLRGGSGGTGRTNRRPASAVGCVADKNPHALHTNPRVLSTLAELVLSALRSPDH